MEYLHDVDDWRHITDPKERKRVQNRLSQRKLRKREKEAKQDLDHNHKLDSKGQLNPVPANTVDYDSTTKVFEPELAQSFHQPLQTSPQSSNFDRPTSLLGSIRNEPGIWSANFGPFVANTERFQNERGVTAGLQADPNLDLSFTDLEHPTFGNPQDLYSPVAALPLSHYREEPPVSHFNTVGQATDSPFRTQRSQQKAEQYIHPHQDPEPFQSFSSSQSRRGSSKSTGPLLSNPRGRRTGYIGPQRPQKGLSKPFDTQKTSREAAVAKARSLLDRHGLKFSDLMEPEIPSPRWNSSHGSYAHSSRHSSLFPELEPTNQLITGKVTKKRLLQMLSEYCDGDLEKVVILYLKEEIL